MKFQVTFKDPDVVDDAIREEANRILETKKEMMEDALGFKLSEEEKEAITEARIFHMQQCAEKFVKWGEYITIEFNPEDGTATVVPVNK